MKKSYLMYFRGAQYQPPVTMSILGYNGGAVLAMTGDQCVAVCSDLRYGRELQTISTDFTKVGCWEIRITKIYYYFPHRFLK